MYVKAVRSEEVAAKYREILLVHSYGRMLRATSVYSQGVFELGAMLHISEIMM